MAKAFRGIFTSYSSSGYYIWNSHKQIFVISNYYIIKEYIKGVCFLNLVFQLYRRLVSTTKDYNNTSSNNTYNPDIIYGDTIIINTRN
jgi:hypothetical protein